MKRKNIMKKSVYVISGIVFGAVCLWGQDYVKQDANQVLDGGVEAVVIAQDSPPVAPQPVVSAKVQLEEWAKGRGFKSFTWDPHKNRILKLVTVSANIGPSEMGEFTEIRESLYVEAELSAKSQIIEAFMTTASATNLLSIPGNPIAKQLEKEQKNLEELRRKQEASLIQAREDATQIVSALDQATAEELRGIGYGDRLKALLDATIKKIDDNYSKEKLNEEQKQRVDDLKLRVKLAKQYEEAAANVLREIEGKIESVQGDLKKRQSSVVETTAEMPLFGAVTLAQAESYDELRGNYQLAILMAWSPKLEIESRSILLGSSKVEPRPNKKSFDEWLNDLDLSVMVGSRRFLPSDGTINFVGIAAVEYDPDYDSFGDAEMEAGTWAKQYAILSLTGDVSSYRRAERERQVIRTADGKTKNRMLKDFSVELRNTVEGLDISGLDSLFTKEVIHPASGKRMMVAVASVNSDLATKASAIMADTYATLKELNESQSYRSGQIEGMKVAAAASKDNKSTMARGFSDGQSSVISEYDSRQPKDEASPGQSTSTGTSSSLTGNPGTVQSGTFMSGVDDVDDDF